EEAAATLLPPAAAPGLGLIAQVGVILYMFLVGLETNTNHLQGQWRRTVAISTTGMVMPFLAGATLAFAIGPQLADPARPLWHFALFMGVALSITAFPVLARFLAVSLLLRTPIGMFALGWAAAGGVSVCCVIALA